MLRSLQRPDLDTGEQRHVDATVGSDVEDLVVAISDPGLSRILVGRYLGHHRRGGRARATARRLEIRLL